MEIKNIGQLIQHLASKAGIQVDDKNLVNILSNADLTKIPIHSDLVKLLDENLLSIEAATDNHPTIGTKYKAQALNAIDKTMQRVMDELELDEDTKQELLGVQSSYKRLETLGTKLKDLVAQKQAAAGKGKDATSDALQKQIDELQLKLKTANDSLVSKENEFAQKLTGTKIDFALQKVLATKKTVFDTLTPDVRQTSLMTVINNALQEKDAELKYDENGKLQILKKDGSKLYGANHTLIQLDELIDSTLAQNKILVVAEPPKGGQQQQQQQQNQQQQFVPGGGSPEINGTNQSVVDFNLSQLTSMAQVN